MKEHFGSITIKITRERSITMCLRFDNVSFVAGNDSKIERIVEKDVDIFTSNGMEE